MWAQNKDDAKLRFRAPLDAACCGDCGYERLFRMESGWALHLPRPSFPFSLLPTPLQGLQARPKAHLRVELLLRARVAVLAGVPILTLAGVSPLVPVFYIRTRRRPGPVRRWVRQMQEGR